MKGSAITGPVAKECVRTSFPSYHERRDAHSLFITSQLSYFALGLPIDPDWPLLLWQADLWPRIASNAGTVVWAQLLFLSSIFILTLCSSMIMTMNSRVHTPIAIYIKRLTQTTLRATPTPELMPNSFIGVYVNINSIGIQYDHHSDGRCLHVATRTPSVAKKHAIPPLALCTCAVFKWVQVQLMCWPAENHYLIVLLRPSRTIWRLSS